MKKRHLTVVALAVLIAAGIVFYSTQLGEDDEITDQIVEALQRHPDIDAERLEITFDGGTATVTGTVPDEATRKLVIEEVEKIDGVERVVDKIVIESQ